jgi:hypothetical protein
MKIKNPWARESQGNPLQHEFENPLGKRIKSEIPCNSKIENPLAWELQGNPCDCYSFVSEKESQIP